HTQPGHRHTRIADDAAGDHLQRLGMQQPPAADGRFQRHGPAKDIGHARAAADAVEVFHLFHPPSARRRSCNSSSIRFTAEERSLLSSCCCRTVPRKSSTVCRNKLLLSPSPFLPFSPSASLGAMPALRATGGGASSTSLSPPAETACAAYLAFWL